MPLSRAFHAQGRVQQDVVSQQEAVTFRFDVSHRGPRQAVLRGVQSGICQQPPALGLAWAG